MNNELTLEEIQEKSFEILKKIKEIFDENNWKYYLAYGTLIGAVRHKGFIPWDDDIDIWVPRTDYEKFIDYCIENEDKLKPFKIIHYKNNKEYIYPIARFSDTRYCIEYNDAKEYGLGLFVDIYPLDGIEYNDIKFRKKITRLNKLIIQCGSKHIVKSKSKIKIFFKYPYYLYTRLINVNKLVARNDILAQKYKFEESENFECISWVNRQRAFSKKLLGDNLEGTNLMFNNEYFRVPKEYDEVLKTIYGDYMKLPPENERVAHHNYKAYKK